MGIYVASFHVLLLFTSVTVNKALPHFNSLNVFVKSKTSKQKSTTTDLIWNVKLSAENHVAVKLLMDCNCYWVMEIFLKEYANLFFIFTCLPPEFQTRR